MFSAKIGALVLDEGRWQDRQVIDSRWIDLVGTRVTRGVRTWSGRLFDYGYGWWVTDYQGGAVVTASGARGQWIFVVPSLRLVVVATGDNDDSRWTTPVDFLYSHVLPSVGP